MDKKTVYLAPEADFFCLQSLGILAGSHGAGTTPFEEEDDEYNL